MRRITSVIARPISGSATAAPSATAADPERHRCERVADVVDQVGEQRYRVVDEPVRVPVVVRVRQWPSGSSAISARV
jgi:hypothetical protein